MGKSKKEIDNDRERIFEMLPDSIKDNAYAVRRDGLTGIALFNESYPPKTGLGKYRMKIAADIVALEEEKPFLAIELETSTDPQEVMGLFPLWMLTKWIKLRKSNIDLNQYPAESPFLLLIILPPLTETLREKWLDIEDKLRDMFNLEENKLSTLTDFEICELTDFKPVLRRLLERNCYEKYAKELK